MAIEKVFENLRPDSKEATPVSVEKGGAQENKAEKILLKPEAFSKKASQPLEKSSEGNIIAVSQAQSYQKKRADAIDSILAEGLNEVFLKMNPKQQSEFKKKGEETVAKINELLGQTKVKVNKIIDLIRSWLKLIPGVNKFFLEQEVKIKADRIIKIKDKF